MRRSPFLILLAIGGTLVSRVDRPATAADTPSADPRVIAAWAAGPFETRITLDRPISADLAKASLGRSIAFEVAGARKTDSPGSLRVAAARLDDGGRTLVLTTDPHPRATTYTIVLTGIGPGRSTRVAYDLKGVEVAWTGDVKDATPAWSGWWPTLDPADVRKRLSGSIEHARGLALLSTKGKLTLNTLVTLPRGPATLTVAASVPVEATLNGEPPGSTTGAAVFRTESTGDAMLLSLALNTERSDRPLTLNVTVRSKSGPETPVSADQLTLPWAPAAPSPLAPLTDIPNLDGGDAHQGAVVFASAEAKCASCHKVRGVGGNVGPDLSSFVGRDRTEVYRDIAEPSAWIHPDYLPYTVALKDGRVVVGTVRAEGADAIRVSDTEARVTVVPRAEIDEFRPGATSVMPVGLAGALGEARLRDLIAFLTTAPAK